MYREGWRLKLDMEGCYMKVHETNWEKGRVGGKANKQGLTNPVFKI